MILLGLSVKIPINGNDTSSLNPEQNQQFEGALNSQKPDTGHQPINRG